MQTISNSSTGRFKFQPLKHFALRWLLGLLFISGFSFGQLHAADRFEVSHAQTTIVDGKYYLSADISYSLHSEAKEILERGLAVKIVLQVELFQHRRYWRDNTILSSQEVYFLQRNALTQRYVLSMPAEKTLHSFATAEEAINSLRYIEGIFLADEKMIVDPKSIQARARLVVDVRHFPGPLQYLSKYWDDWRLVSEWYVWPLKL